MGTKLNTKFIEGFVSEEEIKQITPQVLAAAEKIKSSDVLIVIGIGGSYLGARAVIEAVKSNNYNALPKDTPDIYFAGKSISADELKERLSERLTSYMVPQAYMQLQEMPLTANGKIDKKALPGISFTEEELTPPENVQQEELLRLAAEVTGNKVIGIDTDLFAAGLSSLGCIRLCALAVRCIDRHRLAMARRLGQLHVPRDLVLEHELANDPDGYICGERKA